MSRPVPRKPASSRGVTPRPRRLAGRTPAQDAPASPEVAAVPEAPEPADVPEVREDAPAAPAASAAPAAPAAPTAAPAPDAPRLTRVAGPEGAGESAGLASPRLTRVLIGVLGALALALAGAGLWLGLRDDDGQSAGAAAAAEGSAPQVPRERPVVAAQLQALDGVDAAAKAAQEIVAVDYEAYDAEVAAAAKLMTARFAREYRATAEEIRADVVAKQTKVQANVVAQGVVRASRTRLEALVFLNQVVNRVQDGRPDTVVTPFKVLVTMVHTDRGWFVDGLATDEPAAGSPAAP